MPGGAAMKGVMCVVDGRLGKKTQPFDLETIVRSPSRSENALSCLLLLHLQGLMWPCEISQPLN